MRWTTTQPALCVAKRHCGKYHREALCQAHSRMWRNPQSEDGEKHGFANNIFTSDLAVCVYLFPSPLTVFDFLSPSPTTMPRYACKQRFPSISPAYSQRDFPKSVFDLSTMLGGARSVHTVVGGHGKSNMRTVTYVEHLSQLILKVQNILKVQQLNVLSKSGCHYACKTGIRFIKACGNTVTFSQKSKIKVMMKTARAIS